jgi:hypothetical protein
MIIETKQDCHIKGFFHEYLNNKKKLSNSINDFNISIIIFLAIKKDIYHQIFDN